MTLNHTFETNSSANVGLYIPILISLGFAGNIISITVFFRSSLREQTAVIFLTVLAISDSVFLCQLLSSCFVLKTVIYKFVVYLSYVTDEISAWCLVAFTLDRYIGIVYPLRHKQICTVKRAAYIIASLIAVAIIINTPVLFTIVYREDIARVPWHPGADNFNIFDTVVSFLIPQAIIVVLNVCIIYELNTPNVARKHGRVRSDYRDRVVVMLVVVFTVLLMLTLPVYAVRIAEFMGSTISSNIQNISQCLFYTNFGVKFYLYCASWENFRSGLVQTFPWLRWKRPCKRGVLKTVDTVLTDD